MPSSTQTLTPEQTTNNTTDHTNADSDVAPDHPQPSDQEVSGQQLYAELPSNFQPDAPAPEGVPMRDDVHVHMPGPVVPAKEFQFPDPDQGIDDRAAGHESTVRERIADAKKIVVKIGSSSLTDDNGAVYPEAMDRICDALEARMARGSDVIVVSSGAVACGMKPLNLPTKPTDLATKQAAAAVGQVLLAQEWGRTFARYGRPIAQVLLTQSDAGRRDRARNAQRTIDRLRRMHVVPIVNENDAVATSEMRFGDNDRLAALVAHLVSADALVLLSDVDGLYDRNPSSPGARFVPEVKSGNDLKEVAAGDGGKLGTGGMASKLSAARLALNDADVGTAFWPREERLSAWKFWALYAADASGTLRLDAGAMKAVTEKHSSLLAVGIRRADGDFTAGDIVDIVGPKGQVIGRGEVNYDSSTLADMIGRSSEELPEYLHRPVVHRDYLSNFASRA